MYLFEIFCTFFLFINVTSSQKNYENYTVYRVIPKNEVQLEYFLRMSNFSWWQFPSFVNRSADVMVPRERLGNFLGFIKKLRANYTTQIPNVQTLINNENPVNPNGSTEFNWNRYHTLDEINNWMYSLTEKYPDKVQMIVGGTSHEGRLIHGVKVSHVAFNPAIVLEGNSHGREWIATSTITYIINQLLTSNNSDIRELARHNDFYIFPVTNPDAFAYTLKNDRLWCKTKKQFSRRCFGADLNRNWNIYWNSSLNQLLPCFETYPGSGAFSEIEAKSFSEFLKSISDQFYAYISFQSFGNQLLFPFGHSKEQVENYRQLLSAGGYAARALSRRYKTKYEVGSVAEINNLAFGSSVDWVKATFNTPLTYTYKLRDNGTSGFILPSNQIIPTAIETLDSLVELYRAAKREGIPNKYPK